eukprot:TRINITY_DN15852_c0_g1_i1.p1 TRINITY_DN15852_c0_g1~~TRINITY_DN15852_c0_g1_i1.p1  ORF type:complete len:543 (-),score=79.45 TRINITY_DN15852_c0_g1_i1:8-1636(-)
MMYVPPVAPTYKYLTTVQHVVLFVNKLAANNCTDRTAYRESVFPFGTELPVSYTLLDDTSGSVSLGVTFSQYNFLHWGNVYTSDKDGYHYTISMQHVQQDWGVFDWVPVLGIEGVYITSNITNWDQNTNNLTSKTYITWSNGAEWTPLVAPDHDIDGNPILCTGECSLNLRGPSSSAWEATPPVYSNANAIGLLIGVGTIGTGLLFDNTDLDTFFSRDAGMTWQYLMAGPSVYAFGDHGGIWIVAPTTAQTNSSRYTLDQGHSWSTFSFPSGPQGTQTQLQVSEIRTSPGGTGSTFMVVGRDVNTRQPAIVSIDFSRVWPRVCTDSDYEDWFPTDGRTGQPCVLGRQITYRRRIATAVCSSPDGLDHIVSMSNCTCTYEDWECDVGYDQAASDAEDGIVCVSSGTLPPDPPLDCPAGTTYTVSQGYRKVAGDTCQGGLTFPMTTKTCPSMSSTTMSGATTSEPAPDASTGSPVTPPAESPASNGLIAAVVVLSVALVAVLIVVALKNKKSRGAIVSLTNNLRARFSSSSPGYNRVSFLDSDL